ncbi:hypothetical protein [Streptomyces sp. N35]|uniref:hypothetical protein n=1 Tax=Streptomyces sp. N35 TaxID=2795730 RepID=UPI0018F7BB9E|nr:hypothetical protein [Streptomyces sp. N35]
MGEFLRLTFAFPTVLLSGALVVVFGFWLLTLLGAADPDSFDADVDFGTAGLGGVPVTVTVSLLTATAWFGSLAGAALLDRTQLSGISFAAAACALLVLALLAAWRVTRLLVRPLRALFPDEPGPSRQDFVGSVAVIRTGRVDGTFGQAEVTAADGSTAVVQVRLSARDLASPSGSLTVGCNALLYAYDETGEFFWAAPHAALDAP